MMAGPLLVKKPTAPAGRRLQDVGRQHAAVVAITYRYCPDSKLSGPFDGPFHGLLAHDDTETIVRVQNFNGTFGPKHLDRRTRVDDAAGQRPQVRREPRNAVRSDAAEIGLHHAVDQTGSVFGAQTGSSTAPVYECLERTCRD